MSATERTQAGGAAGADLADAVRVLSDRIEALQAEVRRLGGSSLPPAGPGWDAGAAAAPPAASYAWIGSLRAPVRRRPSVPRFLFEALFLAGAAVAAALAELDAPVIVAVMAGAWLLVALIEWAASRAERRRGELFVAPAPAPQQPTPADAAWFVPPVEQTVLETPADARTAVTKLPQPQEIEATVERPAGG